MMNVAHMHKVNMDKVTLLVLLLLAASISAADKPHILFLHWGWANVGYHCKVATKAHKHQIWTIV